MIKSIATIAVYVDDQEKALDFWVNKVGFVKKADNDMGHGFRWIEVAPKDAESAIVLYPKQLMPIWNELKPSVVFNCTDVDKYFKELSGKGVEFSREPQKKGQTTFASFKDPEGNEFLLRN